MNRRLVEFLILFFWNSQKSDGLLSSDIYTRNESVSKIVPVNDDRVFVRSLTECAVVCQSSATCDVFYHSTNTQTCYILYSSSEDTLSYTTDSSASCFSKPASSTPTLPTTSTQTTATTTTTITTTATPPNWNPVYVSYTNCPNTFTSDVNVIGSHGNYEIRIVHAEVTQYAADSNCSTMGMQLLKPDSENKVDDVSFFLVSCTVYDKSGYWTDAKRQPGGGNNWTTSDYDVIPVNAWCSGNVGTDVGDDCARLDTSCNYKLKDKPCTHLSTNYGYICELL